MTRFSILIPTWKNLAYLDLACRSICAHSAAEHEIIVFFNEFDDDCRKWAAGRKIIHESSDRNLGVCGAVNRAAKLAACDFVCFMNDDMYCLPGWDTALEPYLRLSDKIWISGTAVEAGEATPCYIGGCDYGNSPETFQEQRILADCDRIRRPYNIVSTWTPVVMPRSNWEAIGGFDENYFPGSGSDPDLAMKMHRHGCRHFIGVGTSIVYHFSRATTSRFDGADVMDPKAYFKAKWKMSWRRFFKNVIHRDSVITPALLERMKAQP